LKSSNKLQHYFFRVW